MDAFFPKNPTGANLNALFDSPAFENNYTYLGGDLGFTYSKEATTWKLWSPLAEYVELRLYATGSDFEAGARSLGRFPMARARQGVWELTLDGDFRGVYYTFYVGIAVEGDSASPRVVARETADPYARSAGLEGARSLVLDMGTTNPENWRTDSYNFGGKMGDAIVWEIHIGDFSYATDDTYAGKYKAFTNPKNLAYLKNLGITHVQLMPVFDFATMGESGGNGPEYNWGYDPKNYNVPEGAYSTDPYHGEARVRELKELVQALHRAGIGVIMDVVYNHVYDVENSVFQKAFPYYYFRLRDGETAGMGDGSCAEVNPRVFANGSGCGNEIASERAMVRQYIVQSVVYWAQEYHMDGFRFDLMGLLDTETMYQIRSSLKKNLPGRRLLLYGEPWAAEAPAMRQGAVPADKGHIFGLDHAIGFFDDTSRDALRGNNFRAEEPGFLAGVCGGDAFRRARAVMEMAYGAPDYARVIHYISCHDNLTLWDKLSSVVGMERHDEVLAMNKIGATAVMLTPGMALMLGGEEFGRTKHGDGNSYRSPFSINALDWSLVERRAELVQFYKGLIQIRKAYMHTIAENLAASQEGALRTEELAVEDTFVAWMREFYNERLVVMLNPGKEDRSVTVPRARWSILANERMAAGIPLEIRDTDQLIVKPQCVLVAFLS